MPRLLRPYIPLDVRIRVLARQLGDMWPDDIVRISTRKRMLTKVLALKLDKLASLLGCHDAKGLHLDHDPALENREKVFRRGAHVGYRPDANDPEFLIYREKHAHHIKTNVRGDGAQYPDRVLAKRERRRRKKLLGNKVQRALVKSGPKMSMRQTGAIKRRWAKRKLRSANRWPKRKINLRADWRG